MTRAKPGPIVRQELAFVEFNNRRPGMPSRSAKPVAIPPGAAPDRVWTLYFESDRDNPPALPFTPVHNSNAFLEDWMHDWNIGPGGKLHYASRVIDRDVWILLEYR